MAMAVDEFTDWLGKKLQALNTDESVFTSYITGILDGDESLEEKTEAIQELLAEITVTDISIVCKEILDRWQKSRRKVQNNDVGIENVDEKLVRLLESQSLTTTAPRVYTAEERKIKEAILAQYSQTSDDEDAAACPVEYSEDKKLERNTNAQVVHQAEKEKREQAKVDSQKKKDKDKEDREKQKQMKEDKKEKRKTQKVERKR